MPICQTCSDIRVTPWLSIAPTPEAPPDSDVVCPSSGDVDTTDLDTAARALAAPPRDLLLAAALLGPEAIVPLAAALLVVRGRQPLLAALQSLGGAGCEVAALPAMTVATLLRLELAELGTCSDVTALEGAPRAWTWLSWPSGVDGLTVVSRGRAITAQRLRPAAGVRARQG